LFVKVDEFVVVVVVVAGKIDDDDVDAICCLSVFISGVARRSYLQKAK
jgi:hypothetical protein